LSSELSSYFTGASIGVPYNPEVHENHAGYLKNWISVLEDEEKGMKFFNEASNLAKKSSNYQLDRLEKQLIINQSFELKQDKTQEVSVESVKVDSQEYNKIIIPPKQKQYTSIRV
jgi:antirestriction protein ArdC